MRERIGEVEPSMPTPLVSVKAFLSPLPSVRPGVPYRAQPRGGTREGSLEGPPCRAMPYRVASTSSAAAQHQWRVKRGTTRHAIVSHIPRTTGTESLVVSFLYSFVGKSRRRVSVFEGARETDRQLENTRIKRERETDGD